jgi:membrane-associated phospholipid phosphatase
MLTRKSRAIVASTLLVATVIICIALVDRRIATWFDARFHGSSSYGAADAMFRVLHHSLPIGGVLLVVALVWQRWKVHALWLDHLVSAGVAAAVTLGVTLVLKFTTGRSQVDPEFLRQHIYTFHLLGASAHYGSFPSATMSGVTAFVTGLDLPRSPTRIVLAAVVVLLTLALLITNGHWLSDIVVGTYLGVLIGRTTARMSLHRPRIGVGDIRSARQHPSEPRRP